MNTKLSKVTQKSGGELVVDGLVKHKVRTLFGVPGESCLPVLDALVDNPAGLPVSAW